MGHQGWLGRKVGYYPGSAGSPFFHFILPVGVNEAPKDPTRPLSSLRGLWRLRIQRGHFLPYALHREAVVPPYLSADTRGDV